MPAGIMASRCTGMKNEIVRAESAHHGIPIDPRPGEFRLLGRFFLTPPQQTHVSNDG